MKLPTVLLALAVLAPLALAAEPSMTVKHAIATLLDSHASTGDKYAAADAMGRMGSIGAMGRAARFAVPALLRQSRYDLPYVRERAVGAIEQIVGTTEARRLIAADRAGNGLATAAAYLFNSDEIDAMADAAPDALIATVVAGLIAHDAADPKFRREILDLVIDVDPRNPAAVPLVLRSLDSGDDAISTRARKLADELFTARRAVVALVDAMLATDDAAVNVPATRLL